MTKITISGTKYRIESIDILRGLIMLLMAIDHSRDFFHAYSPKPTDLATTIPMLFFTRWITHFCAALFVFLSGISINLAGTRRTKAQLSVFLLKRGIWLIAAEFILITLAITLDPFYHLLIFQVIWVIGVSMILMAALIWAPIPLIAFIGGILFFGHDILNLIKLPTEGLSSFLWRFLFTGVVLFQQLDKSHSLLVLYALLPWTGVMLMGYVLGQVYHTSYNRLRRKKILIVSGISLIFMFFFLRAFNIYGDPKPWSIQHTEALTVISFFNVSKYPPSLLYLCMTIGPGLLFLFAVENVNNIFTRILKIYGNVPFFYYLVHFYLLRAFSIIVFYVQGYTAKDIVTPKSIMLFRPVSYGFNLFGVYLIWLLVIAVLYLPCKWFSNYKNNNQRWWLSYL